MIHEDVSKVLWCLADCGGNLSGSEGGFASPNWPRNYAHHEDCMWHITTSEFKVRPVLGI